MKTKIVKITDLIEVPEFKTKNTTQSIDKLVMSLSEFGQVFPILVTPSYEIINGLNRVKTMKALGFKDVKVKIDKVNYDLLNRTKSKMNNSTL